MGEIWWSVVKCPNCGKLMSVQQWYDKLYRVTCECGKTGLSGFSDGKDPDFMGGVDNNDNKR